jgi:hypothetical protein
MLTRKHPSPLRPIVVYDARLFAGFPGLPAQCLSIAAICRSEVMFPLFNDITIMRGMKAVVWTGCNKFMMNH